MSWQSNEANGKAAVWFDNADYFTLPDFTHASANYTLAFVIKPYSADTSDGTLFSSDNGDDNIYDGDDYWNVRYGGPAVAGYSSWYTTDNNTQGSIRIPTSDLQILVLVLDSSGGGKWYLNGVLAGTGNYAQQPIKARVRIGGNYGGTTANACFYGLMFCAKIYDSALSDEDRIIVEDELASYYGKAIQHIDESNPPASVVLTNAPEDWMWMITPNGTYTKMASCGYGYYFEDMENFIMEYRWVTDANHASYQCTFQTESGPVTYTLFYQYDNATLTTGKWTLADVSNWDWTWMGSYLAQTPYWLYKYYPAMGDWKYWSNNQWNTSLTVSLPA